MDDAVLDRWIVQCELEKEKKNVHPLSVCTAYQEMWLYSSINRLPLIPLEEIIVVGYCVWPEGQYIVFIPNHLYKCYISPLSRFLISLWNWRSVVYLSLRSYIFCVHLLGSHHNFFGRWLFFFFTLYLSLWYLFHSLLFLFRPLPSYRYSYSTHNFNICSVFPPFVLFVSKRVFMSLPAGSVYSTRIRAGTNI